MHTARAMSPPATGRLWPARRGGGGGWTAPWSAPRMRACQGLKRVVRGLAHRTFLLLLLLCVHPPRRSPRRRQAQGAPPEDDHHRHHPPTQACWERCFAQRAKPATGREGGRGGESRPAPSGRQQSREGGGRCKGPGHPATPGVLALSHPPTHNVPPRAAACAPIGLGDLAVGRRPLLVGSRGGSRGERYELRRACPARGPTLATFLPPAFLPTRCGERPVPRIRRGSGGSALHRG